jgi:RNA polymerase sigma-70 factor, ECF subfamily
MTTAATDGDELNLVRSAQEGDPMALSQLYRRYLEDVYRFLYARTGSQTDAEDLTAEVFYKMVQNLKSFNAHSTFRTWLLSIARYTLMDFYRQQYKTPEVPLEQLPPAALADTPDRAPPSGPPSGPPAADNNAGKSDLLADILQALPENYRRILELRFIEACSVKEAAQAMGITQNYAKVLQHRALNKAAEIGAEQFNEVYDV